MLVTNSVDFQSSNDSVGGEFLTPDVLQNISFDMGTDLPPEEDFFQQLSNDLEIPMLLEDSLHKDTDVDMEALLQFQDWETDSVFGRMESPVCEIKEEIKIEPDAGSLSPSSSYDSWTSIEPKVILETPPVTPPQSTIVDEISPPTSPTNNSKDPVIILNGSSIKLVPYTGDRNSLKVTGKQAKVVMPMAVKAKPGLMIQPRLSTVSHPEDVRKTIVVLSQDEQNKLVSTNILRIANQSQEPTLQRQDMQLKAIKRQQRMIKNRESACLSRKKKKEYVTSLEAQINELHKENVELRMENEALKCRLSHFEESPTYKKNALLGSNVRKTTAILAVLFMVSFNVGSLSLLSREKPIEDMDISLTDVSSAHHRGRNLLWTETELENLTSPSYLKNKHHPTCPLHINQTESLRIDSELRKWIGEEDFTLNKKPLPNDFFLKSNLFKVTNSSNTPRRIKRKLNKVLKEKGERQIIVHQEVLSRSRRKISIPKKENSNNAVEVLTAAHMHASLLRALQRKEDTFYLVSFSDNHLLLPAIAHNNSVRPKMSLILPAFPFNETLNSASSVTMMQIDCEVLDTRLLELQESDIPEHLRHTRSHASSAQHKNLSTNVSEPERSYRPYFLRATGSSRQAHFNPANIALDPYSPVYDSRQRTNDFV